MTDNQVATILQAIRALEHKVVGLEDRLGSEIAGLKQDTSGLKQDTSSLKQDLASLRQEMLTTRADIMDRIDRLQDRLVAQQEDNLVAMGSAEKALQLVKTVRDEGHATQEQIFALVRALRVVNGRLDRLEDRTAPGG